MILGKTDNMSVPSLGNGCMVKVFDQFRSDISSMKRMNMKIMAARIEKTPITAIYLSFYTFLTSTAGAKSMDITMVIKACET